jgi:DNA polymerase-3 subunit epsilon
MTAGGDRAGMSAPVRRSLFFCIAALAILAVGLGGIAVYVAGPDLSSPAVIAVLAMLFGLIGLLWVLHTVIEGHFDSLDLVTSGMLAASSDSRRRLPACPAGRDDSREIADLRRAARALVDSCPVDPAHDPTLLAGILATIRKPMLAITANGQVTMANASARRLLADHGEQVGGSMFGAIDRDSLLAAIGAADTAGKAVETEIEGLGGDRAPVLVSPLAGHGGYVLRYLQGGHAGDGAGIHSRADLHVTAMPPVAERPDDVTPLDNLAVWVIDTETTGLDVATDRVVQVGGVRLHGRRIYAGASLDRLVNPGRPIPAASTAVHGISDEMVRNAPAIGEVWADAADAIGPAVWVGHNIGFDIAILRRQASEDGFDWQDPPWLDTLQLCARLFPRQAALDLEAVAPLLGVDIHGRHTALGDALVTAEVWVRLIPLLQHRGIDTFGAARQFAAGAKRVIEAQKARGW